jgi:hypothetical protein
MKTTLLCVVTALAALVSGCGGGATKTTTKTVAVAAASTPAASTPATTTPVTEAAAPADSSGSSAGDDKRDPITVKGVTGDTLTLLGQGGLTADSQPKPKPRIKVTLKSVIGPFSGFNLPSGHKLIGIKFHVVDAGKPSYSDPLPGGTLILIGGETGKQTNLIQGTGKSPCDNPSVKLVKVGQSKDFCIAFDVPTSAKLQNFQYATDSGYGDTGLWKLG